MMTYEDTWQGSRQIVHSATRIQPNDEDSIEVIGVAIHQFPSPTFSGLAGRENNFHPFAYFRVMMISFMHLHNMTSTKLVL